MTARHFLELTKYVSSRFMNSSLGRSTINTKNSSLQTVQAEHKEMIPGQKVASFQPFGLVYNECSLAALANWSTQSDVTHATPNGEHLITTSSIVVPAASSTYRKCSICDNFGHYEIECLALLKQSTITSMADPALLTDALGGGLGRHGADAVSVDTTTLTVGFCPGA